jgi:Asp-tRNA(Asn)/Glu-tRNA(Gln) amidotransferase A subunit family amidase
MARTVEDVARIFRVIAGFDSGDAMASPIPLSELDDDVRDTITIGYFEEHPSAPVTPETRAAVREAAAALRTAGLHVEPFSPDVLSEAREHWWTLFVRLGAELLVPEFKGREAETSTILTFADRKPTKEDLLSAWFQRDQLRLRLDAQMKRIRAFLCPVCSVPAFKHGEREWIIDGKQVSYMDAMSYTQWFNLLGNPAVVLPVGQSPEGLPIGIQIVGKPNDEELILKIGCVLEQALGNQCRVPIVLSGVGAEI